jgi:asparagine N-glycosylation enzyme membrane subunit Stt3
MEPVWIAIAISALVVIMVLLLISRRKENQLINPSNLLVLGMSFVVLGIIFGDERVIGYSFIGIGVLLSVIDAIRNRKQEF